MEAIVYMHHIFHWWFWVSYLLVSSLTIFVKILRAFLQQTGYEVPQLTAPQASVSVQLGASLW